MATIAAFRNAMEAPLRNFKTLGLMTPGDRGILRSKYFAEAEVLIIDFLLIKWNICP